MSTKKLPDTGTSKDAKNPAGTGTESAPQKPMFKKAAKSLFKKISDFAEKWIGKSPQDIAAGLSRDEVARCSDKDILEQSIGIHGYLMLHGEFEGRPRPFVVICCTTLDNLNVPFTVSSSGMVIIKKLQRIAEKSGFPVAGKIIKEKSYYDLIDADETESETPDSTASGSSKEADDLPY